MDSTPIRLKVAAMDVLSHVLLAKTTVIVEVVSHRTISSRIDVSQVVLLTTIQITHQCVSLVRPIARHAALLQCVCSAREVSVY